MTAYLVDLGHKVGGLLCRVPNLTQCESNDCIRHSMYQYVNSEAPKQHSSCASTVAIMPQHLGDRYWCGRVPSEYAENSLFCTGSAGRTYCDQVVCEAVVHKGVLGHLQSHAGHVKWMLRQASREALYENSLPDVARCSCNAHQLLTQHSAQHVKQ